MIKFIYLEETKDGATTLYVSPSEVTHVKTDDVATFIYTKNKEVTFVIPTIKYNAKAVYNLVRATRELNERG